MFTDDLVSESVTPDVLSEGTHLLVYLLLEGTCPPIWKSVMCWPRAPADMLIQIKCPDYMLDFNNPEGTIFIQACFFLHVLQITEMPLFEKGFKMYEENQYHFLDHSNGKVR